MIASKILIFQIILRVLPFFGNIVLTIDILTTINMLIIIDFSITVNISRPIDSWIVINIFLAITIYM